MPTYIVSKSDLEKLARGRSLSNRSFAVLDEESDLDEVTDGHLSDNQILAVLNREDTVLGKRVSGRSLTHLFFSMLYLGLFIGFLITTIAVDMPSNKHKVFLAGTILFGAVSLCLFIWWMSEWYRYRYKCMKVVKELPTYDATIQFD